MRHVDLQEIELPLDRKARRVHVVGNRRVHVGARHLARHGAAVGEVRDWRRGDDRPSALGERLVVALPQLLRRPLAAGVTELDADGRVRLPVHEAGDTLPCGRMLGLIQPGTTARNARVA